ncbi:MAG TPA: pyridoxal phosphate-dependent aminotransferase [Saprospiraceae bacterium]|nr:pyridoxal phosphate-dependent aminotransferase [Saprospiraceae bacterium]
MIESYQSLLSDRVSAMTESATLRMAQKARELKSRGLDIISLSLGEPDFDTPLHIIDAAKKALNEGYTRYTPVTGLQVFKEAIVEKFKRDNDLHFTPGNIVVSNGAKQSISNICFSLLNSGDEVIIFSPYWVSYYEIVAFAGGKPIPVHAGIEQDFKVVPEQLEEAITPRTKAVLFSSPCNPTGSVYLKEELQALAQVCAKYPHILIISDEIYEYINFTGNHFSIGSLPSVKDQTVTVNGMSKGFAMTGWRLGYMGAPLWLAEACNKVQGQSTSGATSFGQKAAALALLSDLGPTLTMTKAFEKRKLLMIDGLATIKGLIVNQPQGAFYIFPNISEFFGKSNGRHTIHDADDFCEIMLEEAQVAMVSGAAFGDDQCVRLSYAASEDQLKEAIRRLRTALAEFI